MGGDVMTKTQAKAKVRHLAQGFRKALVEDAEYLIESGHIELSEYDDDYLLPRILISAAMSRKMYIYYPHMDDSRKAVKDLESVGASRTW
jgi:hypothetical protein